MENAPVVYFAGFNWHFQSPERRDRYFKWSNGLYIPATMQNPGLFEYSRYELLKKNPDYPENLTALHYANQSAYDLRLKTQDNTDIQEDMHNNWGIEWVWGGIYRLLNGFRRETAVAGKGWTTAQIVNAPLMHVEVLNLEPAAYDKYVTWFNSVGADVFVPLFLDTTSLMGWDVFEWTGRTRGYFKITKYPKYLSLLYFQNIEEFNSFEKSPVLAAFKRAVKYVLPDNISYQWYVQYLLWDIHRREV